MKSLKRFLLIALIAASAALPAAAQFRFGIKGGAAINKLHLNRDMFDADNRAGFTGGVMVEFTAPVIGIGMDASVLYANRGVDLLEENNLPDVKSSRSYIDIPINLKWKLSLPVVNRIIAPFITTGPDFSFLCSKKNFQQAWSNRKFDFSWNVGAGVELLRHLQVAASYGIGITKSASGNEALNGGFSLSGRNRVWTVTAAYLF